MKRINEQQAKAEPSPGTPCLCTLLRRASRAVTRVYDAEFRDSDLRVTQYALLSLLNRSGETRQRDLSTLMFLEETSLTRAVHVLDEHGWISVRVGQDRREKLVAITNAGKAKLEQSRPAWLTAQKRLQKALPEGTWEALFALLPNVATTASEL